MEITCRRENCGKVCKSLQGWKQHMSATHGGYDEADLQEVAGIGGGEGNVRERMAAFAQTMPGGEGGEPQPGGGQVAADGAPSPPAPVPTERRVRATPKKLRKILAGIPSEILRQTGIELDNEDVEAMDEAGEFLSDVFGFEFVVPESKVTVQSRWWAFVWVAGVAGLVYVKHRFPEVFKYIFKTMKGEAGSGEETGDGTKLPDNSVRASE